MYRQLASGAPAVDWRAGQAAGLARREGNRAARSSRRTASMPLRWSEAICPRRRSTSALCSVSRGPASAMTSRPSASSSAPASRLVRAVASTRCARRTGSDVSSAALQERGRRGQAPAVLCSARGTLEFGGDALIRGLRGLGPVPGSAVRIGHPIGDLRQRAVHLLPLRQRCRPVSGRAHQRMPEPYAGAKIHQPGLGRGRRRLVRRPHLAS